MVDKITLDAFFATFSQQFFNLINNSFNESVQKTLEWLAEDDTKIFFQQRQYRLSEFYENSGIHEEIDKIIHQRATMGADLTEEIYNYARRIGRENELIQVTRTERAVINKLADNSYELIRNVTEEQISSIRRQLILDYAEGVNPGSTSIKQHLTEIQLQPINGWTPERRAEYIARTETRRAMNTGVLEGYKSEGVEYVSRVASPGACKECVAEAGKVIPIDEALNDAILHPNCNCGWKPERNPNTGFYQRID